MGGGLMQLVAYGAQDIYLTGNPQITFFKVVYRRHTNFAMEAIQQTLDGTVRFGNRVSATISRNGDLVTRMYLQTDMTGDNGSVGANLGHTMIKHVDVEIGGQLIDRHTGLWMETYTELTLVNADITSTDRIQTIVAGPRSKGTLFQDMACAGGLKGATVAGKIETMYVPLRFWFCRTPGLALPLIALQYHEVKVILELEALANVGTNLTLNNFQLWADYIYLDTDERRRFAQVSHEYLIEQVQEQSFPPNTVRCDLTFNHPVKELIWVHGGYGTGTGVTNTHATPQTFKGTLGTDTALLKLNGHDRFAKRPMTYFTRVQIYEHHTGAGSVILQDGIAVYSFALQPEEHQPSGTCNFSRIDNAILEFSSSPVTASNHSLVVYAVNYNVLRIMSGMGGLAYSN
jgi:hypothetical protein